MLPGKFCAADGILLGNKEKLSMSKKFWLIIAVIAVAFVGLLIYNNKASNKGSGSSANGQPSNHLEGNLSSKVKLVEYGDYQCPICGEYFSTVQQVAAKYN